MKRTFGESLKARKYRFQVKEIKINVIIYNLSRMISTFTFLIHFKEFYRAEKITSAVLKVPASHRQGHSPLP
jgi:hypothetical protein